MFRYIFLFYIILSFNVLADVGEEVNSDIVDKDVHQVIDINDLIEVSPDILKLVEFLSNETKMKSE